MAEEYWVVGGEYTDTDFRTMLDGKSEERHGPFDDLEAARAEWAGLSMAHVDNALCRYRIEHGGRQEFWVVGGRYKTTEFRVIADGGEEERHGPFADYDQAMKDWQARSMARVDDAHVRYRIEQE
jgi:hypothetical protein